MGILIYIQNNITHNQQPVSSLPAGEAGQTGIKAQDVRQNVQISKLKFQNTKPNNK
jgi:hypothetical protein